MKLLKLVSTLLLLSNVYASNLADYQCVNRRTFYGSGKAVKIAGYGAIDDRDLNQNIVYCSGDSSNTCYYTKTKLMHGTDTDGYQDNTDAIFQLATSLVAASSYSDNTRDKFRCNGDGSIDFQMLSGS